MYRNKLRKKILEKLIYVFFNSLEKVASNVKNSMAEFQLAGISSQSDLKWRDLN